MIVYLKPRINFLKESPRSDTIFGAICWGIRWVYGEDCLKELLVGFEGGYPPFVLSSTFPYVELRDERLHFLPKPIFPPIPRSPKHLEEIKLFKRFKKARYVSSGIFNGMIRREIATLHLLDNLALEDHPEDWEGKQYLVVRENLLEMEHYRKFRQTAASGQAGTRAFLEKVRSVRFSEAPGNAINRLSGKVEEGILFFLREVRAENGGLFFLVKADDPEVVDMVKGAVRFLGDRGIGGDASVGRGQFEPEFSEEKIVDEPETGDRLITLSLLHPSEDDLSLFEENRSQMWYSLVKRKGRIENMYLKVPRIWKETVLNLGEGSVFHRDKRERSYGSAPIVNREDFPVRQNGYAYTVRMVL